MIYELRIYRLHPGRKEAFVAGFKQAKRFMKKYGISFVAAWENPSRPDEFLWIRAFPSLKAREAATQKFYDSPEWLRIVDQLSPHIKRREIRILKAFPFSRLKKD